MRDVGHFLFSYVRKEKCYITVSLVSLQKSLSCDKNILYRKLEINLSYQDSGKSYLVQAADLIAGTTRRVAKNNIENNINIQENLDFIDHKLLFP